MRDPHRRRGFRVAQARDKRPDAILLDWVMPGPSGIDTLQALRRLPSGNAPAVIYCPTEYLDVDVACARAAGAAASQALWLRFDAALKLAYQPLAERQAAQKAQRQQNKE